MERPKTGWNRFEGDLADNSEANLFACISYSLFCGSHTTTYKFCLFKALLDNVFNFDDERVISFRVLANTFAIIYWNSIVVYGIPVQKGFYKGKSSGIELAFKDYIKDKDYLLGLPFESIKSDDRSAILKRAETIFSKYVLGAFYEDTQGMIFGFSKKTKKLWLNEKSLNFLIDNKEILDQVNYYSWLKEVEKMLKDAGQRIDNLSTVLEGITRRQDLTPFKEKLLSIAEQRTCFYCGEKLTKSAHLDHVIPWSFIKGDSLWNFVFACPKCNESKSNSVPDEAFLKRLYARNIELGIDGPDVLKVANSAKTNGVKSGWKPRVDVKCD